MPAATLLVTIDTEEDEWGQYDRPRYHVSNLRRLVALQQLFDEFDVRPTYLITQPVADSPEAQDILAPILQRGACEIGAHCHPWNSPPMGEPRTSRNSMLCNLPSDLQRRKLASLRAGIERGFGAAPTSFRAGRWGFSPEVARNAAALGFTVDSSITPLFSWVDQEGPDFDRPYPERYRVSFDDLALADPGSPLIEIPVTTGFHGLIGGAGYAAHRALHGPPLTWFRARGIASRLGLFRTTWLCPEMTRASAMMDLTDRLLDQGNTILNLMFHSVTLTAGLTPFVSGPAEETRFFGRIRTYLEYCRRRRIGSATLAEAAALPGL